ncbi:hypothetical protein ASB57_24380 [Bordetella sp. N]|nr:hypothetical protein ASB57_24380 [Bordetella sp. N]
MCTGVVSATGTPALQLTGDGNSVDSLGILTGSAGLAATGNGNSLTNSGRITGTAGPGVVMTGGDTTIVNSGLISGNGALGVQTGAGADSFTMNGGVVTGGIDQGAGIDRFQITGGTVNGAVSQGSGTDDFRMTGGTITSLQQGDNRDTFFMSGGRIIGAFEDGDVATMTGGTIGRVDMKLDNNIFDMSGGTIQGNLVTGFGNDAITVSNGFIGGNISVSGGTDSVTITGGRIVGDVRMSTGNDTFSWNGGGEIDGAIDMGPDDDTAVLGNLSSAQLATPTIISGGTGIDTLTFQNAQTAGISRYTQWEAVALRSSTLTMDGDLVLGDAGTGTGTLDLDAGSRLLAVPGIAAGIVPAAAGQRVTVTNAGTLDLTGGQGKNRLTIAGDYVGRAGVLKVDSVLAADDAPSDRLIVAGGSISGNSTLAVTNLGGAGAASQHNGIMVVEATGGTVSSNGAFALPGTLRAGPYEYFLYKGGVTAGSENNWYLRSTVPAVPDPAEDPQAAATAPVAAPVVAAAVPGETPVLTAAPLPAPAAESVPIYREEVPVYGAVAATSRQLALFTLGTFHDRQGEQRLTDDARDGGAAAPAYGWLPGSWARVFGERTDRRYGGDTQTAFDGSIGGVQVGQDIYARRHADGSRDRLGLFLGYANADGDVHGLALGTPRTRAGTLDLDGYSAGAYWTHIGESQWYTDAVAMATHLDAHLRSHEGMDERTQGTATTLSLETGYPLRINEHWTLEPQAQAIAQFVSLDGLDDDIARVTFRNGDAYTARVGARLAGDYGRGGQRWMPYLRVNLWREFAGHDRTVYDGADSVTTAYGSTALQFGAGVAAHLTRAVSVYAAADYMKDVGGDYRRGLMGSVGVRVRW